MGKNFNSLVAEVADENSVPEDSRARQREVSTCTAELLYKYFSD